MPKQIYDVIVIGTGAGGGMAIKTLCDAGLKVCALNSGRRLDPEKDFRNHRMTWEMKYRGFGDPQTRMKDMRLPGLGVQQRRMGTRHRVYRRAGHEVDVAALFRCGGKDKFLGTERGALR